jgi:hypothetical protein
MRHSISMGSRAPAFPQVCWRVPARGSGQSHRRQIEQGLFLAFGMGNDSSSPCGGADGRDSDRIAWVSFGILESRGGMRSS